MANDKRDVVQVLERELSFLESGWYDPSPATSWRAPLIFADSPTCPNFTDRVPSRPCSECVLMQFVPLRHFGGKAPCRHIPLNEVGETVETLYRWGNMKDTKVLLSKWLLKTIKRLEEKRASFRPDGQHSGLAFNVPDAT